MAPRKRRSPAITSNEPRGFDGVTSRFWMMPRARMLFEAAGLQVVPAPAHFVSKTGGGFATGDLLPGASALHHSYYALHEWLGIAWARLSGV